MSSLFLPGAGTRRSARSSRLLFHLRSSDCSLDAITGQTGQMYVSNVSGTIQSELTNATLSSAVGLPRFQRLPGHGGVNELTTDAAFDENFGWPFTHLVAPVTMHWRVWPMHAAGSNVPTRIYGPLIGTSDSEGGWFGFIREGTSWQAMRYRQGAELFTGTVSEIGMVYPLDLVAVLRAAGQIILTVTDATGVAVTSTASAAASQWMVITEKWANSLITLNGTEALVGSAVAAGGGWHHQLLKIARNEHTLASIDKLS